LPTNIWVYPIEIIHNPDLSEALKTNDFDYDLAQGYIAQIPIEPRHNSRLMVVNRKNDRIEHRLFHQVGDYLSQGDVLVINRSRVIPARLFANKPSGGKVEILILRKQSECVWEAMVGGKGIKQGMLLSSESGFSARIVKALEGSKRIIEFSHPVESFLELVGQMPLPPYIHTPLKNQERYQTVYSDRSGSAAAPTAGLHFTHTLLNDLKGKGVNVAEITLHVGLDTFAPVKEKNPVLHKIHQEWCELDEKNAGIINAARREGKKVITVGTTTTRTLETAAMHSIPNELKPYSGNTSLYILPGYQFKVVDKLITNFHLPRSTLIMMVSAFAGWQNVKNWYELAKLEKYRFYSFGDVMLIL